MRLSRRELMRTALGAGAVASLGWSLTEPDEVLAQGARTRRSPGASSRLDQPVRHARSEHHHVHGRGAHRIPPLRPLALGGEGGRAPVPGLAERWEVSPSADRYTFHLRDVKFHDGTLFTADAVKFTFDRIVDPELKSQMAFSALGPYESSTVAARTRWR